MRLFTTTSLAMALAVATVSVIGCSNNSEVANPTETTETTQSAEADLPADVAAELANLSESDRQLAMEQRVCPVAGGLLGSMGTPKKLTVEGREVFICCEGCEDKLRSDPEKYFAKIDNQ